MGVPWRRRRLATSYLKGQEIAQEFGYPLCVRAFLHARLEAGASFVWNKEEFEEALQRGLEIKSRARGDD